MFDEPSETPAERPRDPAQRANEKADELRIHAQIAAVYEGTRKFDSQLVDLDAGLAREVQQGIGRLEKSKSPDHPILLPPALPQARELLLLPQKRGITTNDYHIYRRPGEVMLVRWLAGAEVETFYERLQAHFDAALEGAREDERQAHEWKQDPSVLAYLKALDEVQVRMADRWLRELILKHDLCVLSTQTADELNIQYLAEYVMDLPVAALVGPVSAPPEMPPESELAWFFKLFALRGRVDGAERMCFFTYLQKADDSLEW